jgi:hypothetical protein
MSTHFSQSPPQWAGFYSPNPTRVNKSPNACDHGAAANKSPNACDDEARGVVLDWMRLAAVGG